MKIINSDRGGVLPIRENCEPVLYRDHLFYFFFPQAAQLSQPFQSSSAVPFQLSA